MSYYRVIPRDLFNEAKLLKCLGQLSLIIHDGVRIPRFLTLEHDEPEDGIKVEQDESSGALYCSNLEFFYQGRLIGLRSPYNDKRAYPLQFILEDEEGPVFTESGELSDEFRQMLAGVKA